MKPRPSLPVCLAAALAVAAPALAATLAPTPPDADLDRFLPPPSNAAPGFAVAPYLQAVGPDRATICFETTVPAVARVVLRGPGGDVAVDDDSRRLHRVAASNLAAGTEYAYEVAAAGAQAAGRFRTWPAAPDRVKFFVYGDTRTKPDRHRSVCAAMLARLDDHLAVLHTGDLVASGGRHELWNREFFDPGRDLFARIAVWPCPGNHEHRSPLYTAYFDLPPPGWYYALSIGPVRLAALDVYDGGLSDDAGWWMSTAQGRWLAAEMAGAGRHPWRALVLHTPFYSLGPHGKLDDAGRPQELPMRLARSLLEPAMRAHGYAAAFSGHDHLYERSEKEGRVFITTGGGGAPTYKVAPDAAQNPHSRLTSDRLHFCEVEASSDELRVTAIDAEGRAFDRVEMVRDSAGGVRIRSGAPAALEPAGAGAR